MLLSTARLLAPNLSQEVAESELDPLLRVYALGPQTPLSSSVQATLSSLTQVSCSESDGTSLAQCES